tara:strand:- start:4975 stop:5382 length:408 start_codon:yes stop_codon:yes gene_type:complete
MTINRKLITKGFIAAGLMNMSVFVFSRFITNHVITETDPDVMSNFGLLMIVIWGLAYLSVAHSFQNVKWLIGVFAVEKLFYGINWTFWILENSVLTIFEKDVMAGMFYSIYGINDWLFSIFFFGVFIRLRKEKYN